MKIKNSFNLSTVNGGFSEWSHWESCNKRCNGGTTYGCSTNTQARAWRRYLEEEGLVTPDPLVPPSFSHL